MKYNLTEQQKDLARFLVAAVRACILGESFIAYDSGGNTMFPESQYPDGSDKVLEKFQDFVKHEGGGNWWLETKIGALDALREQRFLIHTGSDGDGRTCTITQLLYTAVDSNFADDEASAPMSTLAHPHPPEIAISLDRLRTKYPDPKKLGFLIMRFAAAKPFQRIVDIIKQTGANHDLKIIRADETEFHADLWGNVRTHLHGCGFGIAVYERIETNEPNANVGLEVGYLMAMNKPVLLLKDKTVAATQSDLTGKLYKTFDPHDPEGTIPDQLTKWLLDNGIVVPDLEYGVGIPTNHE